MSPYQFVSLAVCIAAFVGLVIFEIWLLIDNKKFWEAIDKQRYGCYNDSDKKRRRKTKCGF